MSRGLAAAMHLADGAVPVAVAARDGERARAFAAETAVPSAYGGYDALLADSDIDAVYVGLHNSAHLPITLAALAAGKHVLCDKPLGLTAAEVDQMAAAASAAGKLVVEASMYHWQPRVRLARQLIAEGAIGAVRHVAAGFATVSGWDGTYRGDPALGGGAAYDLGCYPVSAAVWAFGSAPESVAATADVGSSGTDVRVDAILDFDGGEAEVHASFTGPQHQWLVVSGERGEIELPDQSFSAVGPGFELLLSQGRDTKAIPVPDVNHYTLMVEDVSAAIRDGRPALLSLAESRRTAATLDAIFSSLRSDGAAIEVAGA